MGNSSLPPTLNPVRHALREPDWEPQCAEETGLKNDKPQLLSGPQRHLELKPLQYYFFHPHFHLIFHEKY